MAGGTDECEPRVELLQGLATPLPNNQHFLEVFAVEVSQLLLQPLVSRQRARQQQQGGGSTDWQWELACKLAPKVPQEVAAVLEYVHCSRELALWQALQKPVSAADADKQLWDFTAGFSGLQTDSEGQRLAHIAGPEQPQQLLMLHLLLCLPLMRWASSRPCVTSTDVEYHVRVCWLAHQACADFSFCRPQREAGEPEPGEGIYPTLLPAHVLQLLQPHMRALVPQLLQLRRLQLAALQAAGNGESSSSSGDSSPFTDAEGQQLMDSAVLQAGWLTALLADHAAAQALADMKRQGSSSAAAGHAAEPDTWGVGHLCGLLEDAVRAEAQARAQLGPSCARASAAAAGGSIIHSISADLELHRQLLRYLLPGQGPTQSPLPEYLASMGEAGGKAASQLLGLLVGMLKGVAFLLQQSDPAYVQMGTRVCAATLKVAVEAVAGVGGVAPRPDQQDDGSDAAADATAVLPWLVLLGRCCLLMGEGEQGGELCGAAEFMQLPREQLTVEMEGQASVEGQAPVISIPTSVWAVVRLVAGPYAAHLSGLGYDLQLLQEQAWELSVAAGEYARTDDADRVAALQRVSTQLKGLGQSLCAFAVPDMCNNPRCRNVCGPSEAVLVGGRSCLCGGCRVARYCSRLCQKQNWKGQHKPVCEALAAAAASAGGDAAASH